MRTVQTVLALACLTAASSFAQGQAQAPKSGPAGPGTGALQKDTAPKGPTPKMPDGKPDFSGVWNPLNFMPRLRNSWVMFGFNVAVG
jgi:hypothetical protein